MNALKRATEQLEAALAMASREDYNESARYLRLAQVRATIASTESLQRIAESLETLVQDATLDPPVEEWNAYITHLHQHGLAPLWEAAPAWAQWCAIDSEGRRDWYECKPEQRSGFWMPPEGTESQYAGTLTSLPAHVDWERLIWQRPQSDATPDPLADLAPDWSGMPGRFRWFTIDAYGRRNYHEQQPHASYGQWLSDDQPPEQGHYGVVQLPEAVNWRTLIWQRPQAQDYELPVPWHLFNKFWPYAAMDADGSIRVHKEPPRINEHSQTWESSSFAPNPLERDVPVSVTLPSGVTWRDTLTQRPDPQGQRPHDCPFCRSATHLRRDDVRWQVQCSECEACGPLHDMAFGALDAWNRAWAWEAS